MTRFRAGLPHGRGFWGVAFVLLVVMAYSAVPTPLYPIYAARDGFGSFTITVIFSTYALAVMASLFFAGHLSDSHGRRQLAVWAILLSAASAVVFLTWRSLPGLLLGRVLGGLGVGAVAATATAWLAELRAEHRPGAGPRRAETVAIAANVGGIGAGPLVSGFLAQWVTAPLTVPYVVFLVVLAVALVLVLATPETRAVPKPRPRYRPQRAAVPAHARAAFAAAAATTIAAFAAFALFTALAPTFLADALGHTSRALAGATVFVVFAAGATSQLLAAGRPLNDLVATGVAGLVAGAALVVTALWIPSPSLALFLASGVIMGAAAGLLFKGALTTVALVSEPGQRAEALAGLFLLGYLGLAVPVIGLGVLTQELEPKAALLIFAAALVVAALSALRPLLAVGRLAAVPS